MSLRRTVEPSRETTPKKHVRPVGRAQLPEPVLGADTEVPALTWLSGLHQSLHIGPYRRLRYLELVLGAEHHELGTRLSRAHGRGGM